MSHHHQRAGIVGSRRWQVLRRQVFRRDGYRCRSCGRPGRLEVHHVRPLARGGAAWSITNLKALCRACHILVTSKENQRELTPAELKWQRLLAAMLARR